MVNRDLTHTSPLPTNRGWFLGTPAGVSAGRGTCRFSLWCVFAARGPWLRPRASPVGVCACGAARSPSLLPLVCVRAARSGVRRISRWLSKRGDGGAERIETPRPQNHPSPPGFASGPTTLLSSSSLLQTATGEWRNGRRAGFRCQCPSGRGGSSPPSPTTSGSAHSGTQVRLQIRGLTFVLRSVRSQVRREAIPATSLFRILFVHHCPGRWAFGRPTFCSAGNT